MITNFYFSRAWIEFCQNIIISKPTNPLMASRFYSYISTCFYAVLTNNGENSIITSTDIYWANKYTGNLVRVFYPDIFTSINNYILELNLKLSNIDPTHSNIKNDIYNKIVERKKQDKADFLNWNGESPNVSDKWTGIPILPQAHSFQRWMNSECSDIILTPPYSSNFYPELYKEEKKLVEFQSPSSDQLLAINYWAGASGTKTPAGIWLDIQNSISVIEEKDEVGFSYVQMTLSKLLYDSFIICWKNKYKYWFNRPNQAIPGLTSTIPTPSFPGYPSGHATISSSAGTYLSYVYPENKEKIMEKVNQAANSRLWSKIHFDMDNKAGVRLGKLIGETFTEKEKKKNMKECCVNI